MTDEGIKKMKAITQISPAYLFNKETDYLSFKQTF